MENKKAIKNMDYWRKKNNIPGIDTAHEAGLTGDGRAGSAPFQMAKTGSSPNKGFLQNLGQGLIGKGNMGFLKWTAFINVFVIVAYMQTLIIKGIIEEKEQQGQEQYQQTEEDGLSDKFMEEEEEIVDI